MGASLADRIVAGDRAALEAVARAPVRVRNDNLVVRPWGGERLAAYKGLASDAGSAASPFGEAFEIAADPDDPETAAHPSIVVLEDGSELSLPALITGAGGALLGEAGLAAHGARVPLLPKTLDVRELLSVQAHPAGQPELYVVIEADADASLRLGFSRDVDLAALGAAWRSGREAQERLIARLREGADPTEVRAAFARLRTGQGARAAFEPLLRSGTDSTEADGLVAALVGVCQDTLAHLQALPVRAGDVILNARPDSVMTPTPSAEIHALGNPEGREILLLEIRRPGITLRAWDHARFPLRALDVDSALSVMRPEASDPDRHRITPAPLPDHPGVARAVACAAFTVDIVEVSAERAVALPDVEGVRTLHAIGGALDLRGPRGEHFGALPRGASVLLPTGLPLEIGGEGRAVVASAPT